MPVPEFPPWLLEALRAGAIVGFFLQFLAIGWLARKLDEREGARAAADAAHMRTIESLVPLVRDIAPSLDAIGRRLEGLDVLVREDVAETRATRSRRWLW